MKICPSCKTQMSDSYNNCSVCGCDLSNIATIDFVAHNMSQKEESNKKNRMISAVILIIVVAVIGGYFFIQQKTNATVSDNYNDLYATFKDSDKSNISQRIKTDLEKLKEDASSSLVDKDLKSKVEKLEKEITDYDVLNQLINEFDTTNSSYIESAIDRYSSRLEKISTGDVVASDEYQMLKKYIKMTKFKKNNKTWAETKIEEFQTDHYSTISSWQRNNSIVYHTGLAVLSGEDDYSVNIMIEDYNGESRLVHFDYEFNSSSEEWNNGLRKLYEELENGGYCVIAVACAEAFDSDRGFLYNYVTE